MSSEKHLVSLVTGAFLLGGLTLFTLQKVREMDFKGMINKMRDFPEDAPLHCPGPASKTAGKSESCAGCPNQSACATGKAAEKDPVVAEIAVKLKDVKHKILVLSGKGGVGKSSVSAQLSFALANKQSDVGLLDIDICGPSIPKMLGLHKRSVHQTVDGWSPVFVNEHLAVMSIGFLLPEDDDPIIWRGARKHGLIRQFLTDVTWGDLDYLIVDTPPGTSDEHLSIVNYLKDAGIDGAVIVTTPQEIALQDVRKEINFCRQANIPIIGVIENMSGYECESCNAKCEIFIPTSGGAQKMCETMNVPFLGKIPLNKNVMMAGEQGHSLLQNSSPSKAFVSIVEKIQENLVKT
jgi:Mrp family chromosome partitioning ATPase